MSEYAKAIGDTNPKYYLEAAEGEKADYSQIEAHSAYAATYTVPCLFKWVMLKATMDNLSF